MAMPNCHSPNVFVLTVRVNHVFFKRLMPFDPEAEELMLSSNCGWNFVGWACKAEVNNLLGPRFTTDYF